MKKFVLTFLLIAALHFTGMAQTCGVSGITLNSQNSVDNFSTTYSGCKHVVGTLEINGANITSLQGLKDITRIDGNLSIFNNKLLTSLAGLDALTNVGERVSIAGNGITSLTGLGSLKATQYVQISNSVPLTSLAGLNSLTNIIGFTITNTSLTDLAGMAPLLTSLRTFYLDYNSKLKNFAGMPQTLTSIVNLTVNINPVFESFAGIPQSLDSIYSFNVGQCPKLNSLEGFKDVTFMKSISVYGSPLIKDFTGFNSLTSIDFIASNTVEELSGLENVTYLETINIEGNLKHFKGLKSIDTIANINLIDNPAVNFAGLENVTEILSELSLYGCTVNNFEGLNAVTSLSNFTISNSIVNSFQGLEALAVISSRFGMDHVAGLENFSGLNSLTTVSGPTQLGPGGIEIIECNDLKNFSGLESLTSLAALILKDNTNLISLVGLDNFNPQKLAFVSIVKNSLADCNIKSMCLYLGNPVNPAQINSNVSGCNSREEIITSETCLIALPVSMVSFSGRVTEKGNNLSWTTAFEIDNKGFSIESSSDARIFREIGYIEGKGNAGRANTYSFTDLSAGLLTYYRLKQVDTDGAFMYSKIITVQNDDNAVVIYPNPAFGELHIKSKNLNKPYSLKNIQGFSILESSVLPPNPLNVSHLKSGYYIVTIGEDAFRVSINN